MKLTLGLYTVLSLGMALGCNTDAAKKDKGETKATNGEEPEESGPAPKIAASGDKTSEDSPDADFYAEQFVQDGLETDDAEAFDETPALALLGDVATVGETSEAVDANEVEDAVTPPSDEDPTANDMKLLDLIVEFIVGSADADGDGALSESEFVDARFFPDQKLADDMLTHIKDRRTKLFASAAGDDLSLSQDELHDLLSNVQGHVKKLRLLRFLPYADHLAKAWKLKKKDFDANGDGKLDADELKKLRDSRDEQKAKRRASALAASYSLCESFVDQGNTMPAWFKEMQDRWNQKVEKKKSSQKTPGDKSAKKSKKDAESPQGEDVVNLTDPATADPKADPSDVCAQVLDRAKWFGMSDAVLQILKDHGVVKDAPPK